MENQRDQTNTDTAEKNLSLLIALPALNEEATVADVIEKIPGKLEGVSQLDVLVVDDGSDDRTRKLAEEAGATVVSHRESRGVGVAFRTALRHAISGGYDFLVMMDADGQFDPGYLPQLIASVVNQEADFTTASRFIDESLVPTMPTIKRWGNRQMSRLVSRLTRRSFHDVSCGFRCYGQTAMLSLNLTGDFTYTQEVFLNLVFKGIRVQEIAMPVRGERQFGESRVASNIFRYATRTSSIIFRAYRDYRPIRFFCGLASLPLGLGLVLAIFLSWHYLGTGNFSPHKWAGFMSGFFLLLGMILGVVGIVSDMFTRHRLYLEEILYHQRLSELRRRAESQKKDGTPGMR